MFGFVEVAQAATEATAHTGVAATLGLDWRLFVGQLINFLVIFFVLWRFVLRPLAGMLQQRQKMIEDSIKNAKSLEAKLEDVEAEHQRTMIAAKKEATILLEQARKNADLRAQEMLAEAKASVAKIVAEGKQALAAERVQMIADTKKEIIGMVVASTEKILQGVVDEKVDQRWLKSRMVKSK